MPDLGTKHECTSCGTRFYDLGKDEPICPKCGLNQLADEAEEPPADEDEDEDEETDTETPELAKDAAPVVAAAEDENEEFEPDELD